MLGHRFDEALLFACHVHSADERKGTKIPYVSHLLSVAAVVLEYGGAEDEAIAALLHDAVEDHGGEAMLERIRLRFGDSVARIVEGCSDSTAEDPTMKESWETRKKRYIDRIGRESSSVRLVSAADKLANAQSMLRDCRRIGDSVWCRFNAPRDRILWYYDELVKAFRNSGTESYLVGELSRVVEEIRAEICRTKLHLDRMEWWIDAGCVLASKNPSDEDLRRLRGEGFATLVSLLHEPREKPEYDVSRILEAGWTRYSVGIPESGVPSLQQFEDFVAFVREAYPRGKIVVHCSTGAGRAATMGAAYWIDRGLSAAEAIEHIQKVNQHPWDTPERTVALQEFETRRRNPVHANAKDKSGERRD